MEVNEADNLSPSREESGKESLGQMHSPPSNTLQHSPPISYSQAHFFCWEIRWEICQKDQDGQTHRHTADDLQLTMPSMSTVNLREFTDLPMHEDSTASIKPLLNEFVARCKMLNDVLVLDVIQLDHVMLVILEQILVQRQTQDGEYVRDVGSAERLFPAKGEQAFRRESALYLEK